MSAFPHVMAQVGTKPLYSHHRVPCRNTGDQCPESRQHDAGGRLSAFYLLPMLLLLTACGGSPPGGGIAASQWQCAPFARAVSGIALSGDAADWWDQNGGRYLSSHQPSRGAVMIFARSRRLPHGHASVVEDVLGSRTITVAHANWVHGVVNTSQTVVDISPHNDWSLVRVWWPPAGTMGTTPYPVRGFLSRDGRGADPAQIMTMAELTAHSSAY
ncbi:Hypothetical protein GbCGDNIH9_2263 [Granulibacter bethesdensis]|uniref:Peptidase C51 domain-containing protein n=2 Tax=Granulibacter bethesdensis TaxID=364410 RepID=A0AAC9KC09_9PROT|nr:Hypothetical protein GbCGDNIH9_2263 [Granulibacter bethesdensis]APH63175.1 Hypothetical protein GbCGDNIH8_2263 [Granulibacter bethesdensis]